MDNFPFRLSLRGGFAAVVIRFPIYILSFLWYNHKNVTFWS